MRAVADKSNQHGFGLRFSESPGEADMCMVLPKRKPFTLKEQDLIIRTHRGNDFGCETGRFQPNWELVFEALPRFMRD
jgi:hypothetical protein